MFQCSWIELLNEKRYNILVGVYILQTSKLVFIYFLGVYILQTDNLFQNTQRKDFSWSLHLMSEILDCRAVALEKKGHFCKDFRISEHPFLSEHSENVSLVQSVVGCRLYLCSSNKRELHYIFFSENFPKFLVQLFQNTFIKSSVMVFNRVLDCTP